MPRTARRTRTEPRDHSYEEFVRELGAVAVALRSCSANLDRGLYFELREKRKKNIRRSLKPEFKLERVAKDYFDVLASIEVAIHDASSDHEALRVECAFEGHIHATPPLRKEYAERFATSDLRVVMWPYMRQMVSDMTMRMAILPIFLPIIYKTVRQEGKQAETGGSQS